MCTSRIALSDRRARATQSEHSKALAIFPRTMEILDMAGLVDPFRTGQPSNFSQSCCAWQYARAHAVHAESPYQFVAMFPQNITERLLVEELVRKGGTVEYETTFVSAAESDDHVSVTLAHNDQPLKLTAAYVVGSDGAHSAVRHLLKLPFAGAEYDDSFILADVETNDALPANELQLCPNEVGRVPCFQ